MIFIRQQVEQIRFGGLSALLRKIRALPWWFLRWLGTSKYGSGITCHICRVAIFLRPDSVEAHLLLSELLIRLGHFDEALTAWKTAFLLKPYWIDIHNRISTVFFLCGQTKAAQSIIQRCIDAQNDFAQKHQLDKLGIRFLIEFSIAIGHIALLDSYVKMGILGQRSTAHPIVLAAKTANKCYMDYWHQYFPDIITDPLSIELVLPLAKYLEDRVCAVMDASGKQIYEFYTSMRAIQAQWEAADRRPLLALSKTDHERGWNHLRTLGVPSDAWFVGLHMRGGTRERRPRNVVNINTYRLAMESIVARGGWVIRMGSNLMPPLPAMPQVIDYAHSKGRSDWMDVFLWARCRFFVGTQSGPHMVPPTFGVPCVITNWSALALRPWFSRDLLICKLHWSEHEHRYVNFADVISSALGWAESANYLASQGIKSIDNTPEEINAVVIEMLDRLEGKILYSKEDEELQERFDSLFTSDNYTANARIGRDFLSKWAHLL